MPAKLVAAVKYIALAAIVISIALIVIRWRYKIRQPEGGGLLAALREFWRRWRESREDAREMRKSLRELAGRTGLIVEPDDKTARVMSWRLGSLGCRVARSRSGAEALTRARADQPDFVIADSLLSDISAVEFHKALDPRVPVVFTGVLDAQWGELRALGRGVALLAKPYDPDNAAALAGYMLRSNPPSP